MKTIVTKICWAFWILTSILLLATLTADLEITNRLVKDGLSYVFILGLIRVTTAHKHWSVTTTVFMSIPVFVLWLAVSYYLDRRGDWLTQTVLYQHRHVANRTLEFQLQDKGSFGYNRRTVDRIKLLPSISWSTVLTEESLKNIDTLTWIIS